MSCMGPGPGKGPHLEFPLVSRLQKLYELSAAFENVLERLGTGAIRAYSVARPL